MEIDYKEVVKFHGHSCPGLAIGYRMTLAALDFLAIERAEDEELVAIVENDACGTDAVQFISGCTFGKGNFIFKDYGKMVYFFYNRSSKKAVRVFRKTEAREKMSNLSRQEMINKILNSPTKEIINCEEVDIQAPEYAELVPTVVCDICGETVMETKTKIWNKKRICIPCYNKIS